MENVGMSQQLENVIEGAVQNIHTSFPAKIISLDKDSGLATVQSLVNLTDQLGEIIEAPQIPEVPVFLPGGSNWSLLGTVDVGDKGLCIVSECSIESFKNNLEASQQSDETRHNITDAIFLPGFQNLGGKFGATVKFEHVGMAVKDKLFLFDNGKSTMYKEMNKIYDLMSEFMQKVMSTFTAGSAGAFAPGAAFGTGFTEVQNVFTKLNEEKGKLTEFFTDKDASGTSGSTPSGDAPPKTPQPSKPNASAKALAEQLISNLPTLDAVPIAGNGAPAAGLTASLVTALSAWVGQVMDGGK